MRGELAKQAIRADRWLFGRNTLKRLDFFWFGVPSPSDKTRPNRFFRSLNFGFPQHCLGCWACCSRSSGGRIYGAWLFAFAFLTLPSVYYFVTVHARFRHPLEPLIALLGVFLFQSAEPRVPGHPAVDPASVSG